MVRFLKLCFGMLVRLFFKRQSLLLEEIASIVSTAESEFRHVILGDVRGKPIFLYWSSSRSRIGCTIH